MLTKMYGSDNENVMMAREDLRAIRERRKIMTKMRIHVAYVLL